MLVCVKCNSDLVERAHGFDCTQCEYIASKKNNIFMFQPELSENFPDYPHEVLRLHHDFSQKHFWFLARKNLILAMMKKSISQTAKIIELGAGTGDTASFLEQAGYKIDLGEVHESGLLLASENHSSDLFQIDIMNMPFREHYNSVLTFDVIQHIDNDVGALMNINESLSKNGTLLLTTCANKWLLSKFDYEINVKRRYSVSELKDKLKQAGFKVESIEYFNSLIMPLLFLRRFAYSLKASRRVSSFKINKYVNQLLMSLSNIEQSIMKAIRLPFGSSIIAYAKKLH